MNLNMETQADVNGADWQRGTDYLAEINRWNTGDTWLQAQQCDLAMVRWIGRNVQAINRKLWGYLQDCQNCFSAHAQTEVQILAAPLMPEWGVDGFCNLQVQPLTILIDVGRVSSGYWLPLVAHEYCHAHLGHPGHGEPFYRLLCHLCLGLGLSTPTWNELVYEQLAHWPYCPPNLAPLDFWRGKAHPTLRTPA
jgi:hypothetical protein